MYHQLYKHRKDIVLTFILLLIIALAFLNIYDLKGAEGLPSLLLALVVHALWLSGFVSLVAPDSPFYYKKKKWWIAIALILLAPLLVLVALYFFPTTFH